LAIATAGDNDLLVSLAFPALFRQAGTRLLSLAGLADLAGFWYLVGRAITNTKPSGHSSLHATAVVWGDKVFASRRPLAVCLNRRSVAYVVWGRRHPDARRVLARY
jgi:hypothetical protein